MINTPQNLVRTYISTIAKDFFALKDTLHNLIQTKGLLHYITQEKNQNKESFFGKIDLGGLSAHADVVVRVWDEGANNVYGIALYPTLCSTARYGIERDMAINPFLAQNAVMLYNDGHGEKAKLIYRSPVLRNGTGSIIKYDEYKNLPTLGDIQAVVLSPEEALKNIEILTQHIYHPNHIAKDLADTLVEGQ